MTKKRKETVICQICKKEKMLGDVMPAELVREPVIKIIRKIHPDWSSSGFICISDLNQLRGEYVHHVLEAGKGEVSALEEQVMKSIKEHELLSKNINIEFEQKLTFRERLADRMTDFGGSWRFIISFGALLFLWIAVNSVVLIWKPFDPYPFIFLNLVLSCLAGVQAPVIMMSQNRQGAKDRLRSEHDYLINLKAELEIRHLDEKIDHLLMNQWQRLLEIQEIQMDLMEEIAGKDSMTRRTR
jgi:uncharacterized membrane protein